MRAVHGPVEFPVDQARAAAGVKDVSVDGGALVRDTLDAALMNELAVSVVPAVFGRGIPVGAGRVQLTSILR